MPLLASTRWHAAVSLTLLFHRSLREVVFRGPFSDRPATLG
jgi:hypothetical protein